VCNARFFVIVYIYFAIFVTATFDFFFHRVKNNTKQKDETENREFHGMYLLFIVDKMMQSLNRRFRAIGEYHRHMHLYLAGCLTWRKLENTGYRPNLSAILRARIVGRPAAYHARFMSITLAIPIGRSARKLVCRS